LFCLESLQTSLYWFSVPIRSPTFAVLNAIYICLLFRIWIDTFIYVNITRTILITEVFRNSEIAEIQSKKLFENIYSHILMWQWDYLAVRRKFKRIILALLYCYLETKNAIVDTYLIVFLWKKNHMKHASCLVEYVLQFVHFSNIFWWIYCSYRSQCF